MHAVPCFTHCTVKEILKMDNEVKHSVTPMKDFLQYLMRVTIFYFITVVQVQLEMP